MELKLQKIAFTVLAAIIALFGATAVLSIDTHAQDDTYDFDYDYGYDDYGYYDDYYTTSEAPAWFGILMLVCYCGLFIFALVNLVIWIMSLIHCIQNAPEDKKTMWILLIVLVPFANFVYFFTKRKEWTKAPVAAPQA